MAYNSDGYIMIDFTEVDFRRTNQTIEGLYKRCVDVIGTNKFIIVINANGKTPLPSVCSFVNNQYVIESVIYSFTISSNDNLLIKKNTSASELIDDDHQSTSTTYSSSKIVNVVNGLIDDQHRSTLTTWSSNNIMTVLDNNLAPVKFIEKKAQLNVGDTTYIWVDDDIESNMWVLPFTSEYGINPSSVTCTDGRCSMSFNEGFDHAIDIGVRLYKPLTTGV